MMLFGTLMVVGVVLLVFVLVRAGIGGISSGENNAVDTPSPTSRSALEILEERYARGEVSTEEYRERKNTLDESA